MAVNTKKDDYYERTVVRKSSSRLAGNPFAFARSTSSLAQVSVPSATAQPGPSRLPRQGVQDIDRPAHVQGLSQPARRRRSRVEAEPLRLMPFPKSLDGIGG